MINKNLNNSISNHAKNYISNISLKYKNNISKINLASLSSYEFEKIVGAIYTLELNTKIFITPQTKDHGIDAYAIKNNTKIIFQIKKSKNLITPNIGRDLYGTMQHYNANLGILITINNFGPGIKNFILNKNIYLVNGSQLLMLFYKHGFHNFYIEFN